MVNFVEFLHEIKNGLGRFPGDVEILKEAVIVADRLLNEDDLDHAKELLETCILNAKDSPLLVDIRHKLEFTYAWLAARRSADVQNWQAAVRALSPYIRGGSEYSIHMKGDLQRWENSAQDKMDIPSLEALYAFHIEIDPTEKNYLERSLESLRLRDANDKLLATRAELEMTQTKPGNRQDRIIALQAFSDRVRLKATTISQDGQINPAEFENLALQAERSLSVERQQLANEEAESEANRLKAEADTLSQSLKLTVAKTKSAIEIYKSAANYFNKAGEYRG